MATKNINFPVLPADAVKYTAASQGDEVYLSPSVYPKGVSCWVLGSNVSVTVTPLGNISGTAPTDIVITGLYGPILLPFRIRGIKAATTADCILVY